MLPGAIAAATSVATISRVLHPARPVQNVVMQNTRSMEFPFPRQGPQPVLIHLETRATSRWSRFVEGGGLGRIITRAGATHEQ